MIATLTMIGSKWLIVLCRVFKPVCHHYVLLKDKRRVGLGSRCVMAQAKKNNYTGKAFFEKVYQLCLEDLKEIINISRILTSTLDKS